MIAGNVAVCVPNKGCNKNCPYCVSKITGKMKSNSDLMIRNVWKVKRLAKVAQVFCVLLTGKGEPLCNKEMTEYFISTFSEFSVEIQTNGIILGKELDYLKQLHKLGLDIIAISVDNLQEFNINLLNAIHEIGMLSRVTFNITNMLHMDIGSAQDLTFHDLIDVCNGAAWVDQMTIRNIVVPNNTEKCKETKWIEDNVDSSIYRKLEQQMIETCEKDGSLIMKLPYGAVYMIIKVSLSVIPDTVYKTTMKGMTYVP